MATEMKIWQVSDEKGLVPLSDEPLEASHHESDLEQWIEKNPEILGGDLLIIDRQFSAAGAGRSDLLCIDSKGTLVVVELKRASTAREAIAQALDYAAWLDVADELHIQAIKDRAAEYLEKPLAR